MGKVWSKSEVRVSTNAGTYAAGEEVNGQIALYLKTEVPHLQLQLAIVGTEWFTLDPQGAAAETRSVHCLDFSAPVYTGKLEAGQYMFPFFFALPLQVPSSCHCTTAAYEMGVKYYVRVEAVGLGLSSECQFTVVNSDRDARPLTSAETFPMTTCCVIPSSLHLSVYAEKREYWPGDHLPISIAIDASQSRRGTRDILIDLVRFTKLHRVSGLRTFTQLLKGYIKVKNVDALSSEKVVIDADFPLKEIALGANSTVGEIVECAFGVSVTVRTMEGSCSDGPECTIIVPVTIHSAGTAPADSGFPAEWRPAVMPQTLLSLPGKATP